MYGAVPEDGADATAAHELPDQQTGHRKIVTRTRIGGAIVAVTLAAMGAVVSVPRTQFASSSEAASLEKEAAAASSLSKPHIILFTVDDMGWNDIGYHSTDIPHATYFMNDIVKKSVTFTKYYTQPSCTPSRVTMMTGQWAHKSGFQNFEVQGDSVVGIPLSFELMPSVMSRAGYRTYGFGKWNVGHCDDKYLPHLRGFNHYLGYTCPGHGYYDHTCIGMEVRDMWEGFNQHEDAASATWQTGKDYFGEYDTLIYHNFSMNTVRYHAEHEEEPPLFMWLAHHGIHASYDSQPDPPSSALTKQNKLYLAHLDALSDQINEEGNREFFPMRKITASVIMAIDTHLKILVNELEKHSMMDNTVLLVNSDNGGEVVYAHGHPGNNYPLRSSKFIYFEGAVRVPAFIYAPGVLPKRLQGTKYDALVHHVDLIPTLAAFAGLEKEDLPEGLDGYSLLPSIRGEEDAPRDEVVLNLPRNKNWHLESADYGSPTHDGTNRSDYEGVALIVGNFKLLINHPTDKWYKPIHMPGNSSDLFMASKCNYDWFSISETSGDCSWQNWLFDLEEDPNETTNLYDNENYRAVREKLLSRALDLVRGVGNNYGRIVFEYYKRNDNMTQSNPGDASDAKYKYEKAWEAHDNYIVPWGCSVIP